MSEPRFPIDVRVIGVMQKEKSKVYMTSVLWSDNSEVTVYRSLRDFKTLHKQLKKNFPADNTLTLRKKDRVLPRFGARNVKRFPSKGLSKSVDRLKSLEKYCSSLLQCESTVSHSAEVVRFFLPNEQELQPEFTQNSVMILQSDFIPSAKGGADMQKRLSFGNVTQPFVSKTYRCVAPYETKDTKNKPFKVAVDKRLDVLIKDQAGWWLVENEDKRLAWFPAPYLELCDEEEDEDEFDPTCDVSLYCATRSYTSKKEDELCLSIGTVVEVLQMSDNGWWLVRYNRKAGYVPSMYLKPYISPTFSFHALQRKLRSSTINLSTPAFIHKSYSLEVLSESVPDQREVSGSLKSIFSDDGTDFSFSSSDTDSINQSVSSSDGDESLRQPSKDDSGISSGQSSPSISESSHPMKAAMVPRVPPRPQTQEILNRCTTYTRKAALKTSARLFPQGAGLVN
ncbi:NADPH oxidase organizer 1 [Triplophysa tibetana]|uniref:NADPH oxidase organizer 1 n=1 Tax=Triplophysa tibetana TaxID=1572043 RepID=A0A5A9PZP8_9TELE|nr:NADPH oxidase organizer 1 [Triplophysa tibetana]